MESQSRRLSRRSALGVFGATAAAAWTAAQPAKAAGLEPSEGTDPVVQLLLNGAQPATGTYAFPTEVDTVVLDNGLIRFTFGRDDAAGGIVTGWTDTSITASSIV